MAVSTRSLLTSTFGLTIIVLVLSIVAHASQDISASLEAANLENNITKRAGWGENDQKKTLSDFVAQGEALMCLMNSKTAEEAKAYFVATTKNKDEAAKIDDPAKQFNNWADLGQNGWVPKRVGPPDDGNILENIASALKALKTVDDYDAYNLRYEFKHETTTEWDHKGTGVTETFVFNPRRGNIIIEDVANPVWYAKTNEITGAQLPALHKMSDLMFLGWQHTNTKEGNPQHKSYNLKNGVEWVMIESIREPNTLWILNEVCKGLGLDPPVPRTWTEMAHYAVSADEAAGHALLASPLGRIVSWFLIQHKQQMGAWKVVEILVFQDDDFDLQKETGRLNDMVVAGQQFKTSVAPPHMVFVIESV